MKLSKNYLKKPYIQKSTNKLTISSATNAIREILLMEDVGKIHKTELISIMIWKISQANGKWNTRYYSAGTLNSSIEKVQHEHVVTRKQIISQLFLQPDNILEILAQVTACIVTESEHRQLAKQEDKEGWERYRATGIRVYDRESNQWLW